MKYVFGASSHLVFYLCNKIIETDALNPDDCIFFFTRNYHCPDKYNDRYKNQIHTDYNVDENNGRIFAGLNVFKTFKNVRSFDKLVDAYINGEDFLWYSQICNNDFCSLMVTKKNCKGYYVLEDGLGSYRNYNPQTFTGWKYYLYRIVLKPLFRRCFEVKNHFITTEHPKFKGCIATTPYCFPLHQKYLRCVGLPFEKTDLGFSPDAVISIDPLYLYINENEVYEVYKQLSSFVKKMNYKCIAYKYHPYFNAQIHTLLREKYESIFRSCFGSDAIEIPATFGLENVLMTYKSDFYTDSSSVAVYAKEMDVKCYTYIPILRKYTDAYNNVPLIEDFCIAVE